MKKTFTKILLIVGALTIGISSAQTWTPVFTPGTPAGGSLIVNNGVSDISFYDDNNGIVSIGSGGYYRTTDGGSTWAALYNFNPYPTLDAAYIKDSQTILLGTNNGRVYKSINGGTTFSLIATIVSDVNAMDFSGNNGALVDNNCQAAITANLGDSWTAISNTVLCGNLSAMKLVNFSSANTIYIAGNNSNFFKSLNAGATWTTVNTGTVSGNFKGLWFTDDNNGYVTIYGSSAVVLKTTNGGSSWTNITSAISPTLGVIGANSGALYANGNVVYLGADGKILRSIDGGASFSIDLNYGSSCSSCEVKEFTPAGNSLFASIGSSGTHSKVYKRSNTISFLKEESISNNFSIYPNPAAGSISLVLNGELLEINVYDQLSRKVINVIGDKTTLDISSLNPGLYFIHVSTDKGSAVRKFIKQ